MGVAGHIANVLQRAGTAPPAKGSASPGDVFPTEPTITASDALNAAKLGPLGYVADPTTAWTTGQKITVNGFDFNWSGTAWAPGAHAVAADVGSDPANATVAQVQAYVTANPGERDRILAEEQAGANRVTLVEWLTAFTP